MEILTCAQNSPEWFEARMGIPTASEFKTLLGIKKEAKDKATRRTYMFKLAGEIITGEPMESFQNDHMERGKVMEDEARDLYSFQTDIEPERVGFIRNGDKGCSPDSLLGTKGMLEIKTKLPHLLIDCLLKNEFPAEHKAQCQGALWVAEREWIDIAVYWPKLPLFVKRAYRDEGYIANLAGAVREFNEELAATVKLIREHQTGKSTLADDLKASAA
jgi:hypothetical protein